MIIYYLRHSSNQHTWGEGLAFTSKEKAQKCADYNNNKRKWYHKLSIHKWVVGKLNLKGDLKYD